MRPASPSGFLEVRVIRGRDSADLECVVAGNAPDGRAETKKPRYSAAWSPLGFVIRNATGQPVTDDVFVHDVIMPFARYISG